MPEPIAFLNDRWIPAAQAAVPVSDAGLILGTAVTEQLRTFGGRLFHLTDHLGRLRRSLDIVGIDPGLGADDFARLADELVATNHRLLPPGDDLMLSIVVTPGTHLNFLPPPGSPPGVYLHTFPLPFDHWAEKYRIGQALATTGVRQIPPECWPPELKCRSRMHYFLADRAARAIDPEARALLIDAGGFVTEASTANLLVYRAGEGLVSPPLGKILHGISLAVATALARGLGISFHERDLTPEDVASAEEVLLTGTSICVLPVTRFNGRPIGAGRPGQVFQGLLAAWSEAVGLDIAAQAMRHRRSQGNYNGG
jgi:branched-subunit amino acid aminotransferase/4-amino-4-deoxychorismate lyase